MQQYQVNELTNLLKSLIDQAFPGLIMVHGEISSFSHASSGHMYFTLKDDTAKLKAVYFKQHVRRDAFIPKNGDKVSAIGELRIYEGDGAYQLIVRKIEYSAEGDFWRKFEATKAKLGAMGLFDADKKRTLPLYPRRIALLTAATGAAVKDFIVTAKKGGNFFKIDVWPIPVQGKDAAAPIVAALQKAGKRTDLYDALVLSRGGGSLDDLAVFNDEAVALALNASAVPTISAIGHEQDVSICDMVADLRVATPTAAAEWLTAAYKTAASKNERYYTRLLRLLRLRMENAILDTDRLNARLQAAGAVTRLEREGMRLTALRTALNTALNKQNTDCRHKLEKLEQRLQRAVPLRLIAEQASKVQQQEAMMQACVEKSLLTERHRLELLTQQLEMGNPDAPLAKGYALVVKNGKVLKELGDISLNDELNIKMKDGLLSAFVTGKKSRKGA
ncbi:MAG: exodeoxyribonuclease VII large subunit [Deferribacteraceae bacterium]|jgi:exodeoxyribonuclease VII large subunit|nr:exodeoxyribonuclease VII large subunit [Deferribacteraceae bacterium]